MINFKLFDIFNIFNNDYINLSGIQNNVCIHIDYDGSKYYGYVYGQMGYADPEYTNDGQLFYSFIWDADGNFVMQFGLSGDEQVPKSTSILVYSPTFNKGRVSQWNTGSNQYEFTDLQLATDLIAAFDGGETEVCLHLSVEDELVIDYTYDTILTGVKNYTTTFEYAHVLGTSSIELSWNAANPSDSTYELFRDSTSIYTGTATSFTDSTSIENDYVYTLKVYDGIGNEQWSTQLNFTAVTDYELIHVTNNTGGDMSVAINPTVDSYVVVNNIYYEKASGFAHLIAVSDIDIEILYIKDKLEVLGISSGNCPLTNCSKIEYKFAEVSRSVALSYLKLYAQATDAITDVSHLVNVERFTFSDQSMTSIPTELLGFSDKITYFQLVDSPNLLDYVDVFSTYPNLVKFVQQNTCPDKPAPEPNCDIVKTYAVANSSSGDYEFTDLSFMEVNGRLYMRNFSLIAAKIDTLLSMCVDREMTGARIYLNNDTCYGDTNKNEAPTATGEGHIDTLRANGCRIYVEGGY